MYFSSSGTIAASGQKNALSSTAAQSNAGRFAESIRRSARGNRARGCRSAARATFLRSRQPRRASSSRVRTNARRHADRGSRISANRCSRRDPDETSARCPRSPSSARPCCGSAARSAFRSSCLRTRLRGSRPRSASRRCEVCRDLPVARRSRSRRNSSTASSSPGGQPSTTQPIACGPWLCRRS